MFCQAPSYIIRQKLVVMIVLEGGWGRLKFPACGGMTAFLPTFQIHIWKLRKEQLFIFVISLSDIKEVKNFCGLYLMCRKRSAGLNLCYCSIFGNAEKNATNNKMNLGHRIRDGGWYEIFLD